MIGRVAVSLHVVSSELIHTSINRTFVSHLQNKTTVVNKHEAAAGKLSLFHLAQVINIQLCMYAPLYVCARACVRIYVLRDIYYK